MDETRYYVEVSVWSSTRDSKTYERIGDDKQLWFEAAEPEFDDKDRADRYAQKMLDTPEWDDHEG